MLNSDNKVTKAFFVSAGHVKGKFADSSCALPISVGSDYHEGRKIEATIKKINSHFRSCTIIMCDSLQRHTKYIMSDKSGTEAYKDSLVQGDLWLARNRIYFDNFTIPHDIMRWDDWLKHEQYQANMDRIEKLYNTNDIFRAKFDNTVNKYFLRLQRQKILSDVMLKKIFYASLEYLKEECAVTPLWAERLYTFVIYPGKQTEAMQISYEHLVKPFYTDLLLWLHINFKTKKF